MKISLRQRARSRIKFHDFVSWFTPKKSARRKPASPISRCRSCDRTGELDAKMWDNVADVMDTFERDDFVKVKGLIQVFHNRPQLTIHKMRRMDDSEVDFADYFPASKRDPEGDVARAARHCGRDAAIRICRALCGRDAGRSGDRPPLSHAPAAKQIHHAWLGGLIEHVLCCAAGQVCRRSITASISTCC